MFKMICKLLLSVVVAIGCTASALGADLTDCKIFLERMINDPGYNPRYETTKDGLWDVVTDRKQERIYNLYKDNPNKDGPPPANQPHLILSTVGGEKVDILSDIFKARTAAIRGQSGVLGLGEGKSDFISSLLDLKVKYLKSHHRPVDPEALENIQAVDVSYPDHDAKGQVTDKRIPLDAKIAHKEVYDPSMLPIIQRFPKNFHSQRFQDLTLKNSKGEEQTFSLIISNYSLGYVLGLVSEAEMKSMLENVLSHLEPGGKLVMMPVLLQKNRQAYLPFLAELKARGVISDYTTDESLRQVIVK